MPLTGDGNPHISYYDETNRDLKYTYFDGDEWQIETVDSVNNVGQYTSLALDGDGNPQSATMMKQIGTCGTLTLTAMSGRLK